MLLNPFQGGGGQIMETKKWSRFASLYIGGFRGEILNGGGGGGGDKIGSINAKRKLESEAVLH